MAMSRIRHLVWPMQSDARNSSGDENARAAKPNSLSRSGSDSRTDSSSSTTDTSKRVTVIDSSCHAHGQALRKPMCPSHTNPGSGLTTRLFFEETFLGSAPRHEPAPLQEALSIAP